MRLDKEDDVRLGENRASPDQKRDPNGAMPRSRRKNIDDRFRSLMLTQISPRAFRIVDAAAANVRRLRLRLRPIFFESLLCLPLTALTALSYSRADLATDKTEYSRP